MAVQYIVKKEVFVFFYTDMQNTAAIKSYGIKKVTAKVTTKVTAKEDTLNII